MRRKKKMKREERKRISGQVLTEFAMTAVIFALTACALLLLLGLLTEYGWRILSFTAWEPFS